MKLSSAHLIGLALAHRGEYHKIARALKQRRYVEPAHHEAAITIFDRHYPNSLRLLTQPPFVLFYQGNINLLSSRRCVAIIGSRKPSAYGIAMTRKLVDALPNDVVIVSGLAKGIDGIAHQHALHTHGCVGVLGCGIERVYPRAHHFLFEAMAKQQLLLSEYPDHVPGYKHHFVARNRIIAALSNPIYVMAAQAKSGTLITVDYGLALQKDIVVLPYNIDDASGVGCNNLIASGALMLTNAEDLFIIENGNGL
ncbi:MAG: DNA-protecting protein DprA [Erysipelothrix sp.]|jgi:DNA processing protein|nr:DNA-protecting protein DprA [Erysipelothrix sp.]